MSAVADPIGILARARSDCVVGAKPSTPEALFRMALIAVDHFNGGQRSRALRLVAPT